MSAAPKKLTEKMSNTERWEALKANGIEIETLLLHQAGAVFTRTDRTINSGRPSFGKIKIWRTPTCYLLELGTKREIIEVTSVFSSKPV